MIHLNTRGGERLDYIENDATNLDYIVTDIVPLEGDTGFEAVGMPMQSMSSGGGCLCGARSGDVISTDMAAFFGSNGYLLSDWNRIRNTGNSYTVGEKGSFMVTGTPLTPVCNKPIYILACNASNLVTNHMRIYRLVIFGSDGNVRVDLYPYRINGEVGMYDVINRKFYTGVAGKLTGGYDE